MMYPFLTLDDGTEITHSEKLGDASVKVYIEKADEKDCFHHATCYLPSYRWEDVFGFSKGEMDRYKEVVESTAHLILEFAETVNRGTDPIKPLKNGRCGGSVPADSKNGS